MNLVIFNGSPRGEKSNTKLLLDNFLKGFSEKNNSNIADIYYLQKWNNREKYLDAFEKADFVILAFPLYTDAMPALVKYFIEGLKKFKTSEKKPSIGFIVQSGFPETIQSRAVEKYLEKLSRRLNLKYLGTVIKGGVEGIQIMPPSMTKKLYLGFYKLGEYFAINQSFDESIIKSFAETEKMPKSRMFVFRIMQKFGFADYYWNSQLKKNNAWKIRYNKPFTTQTL